MNKNKTQQLSLILSVLILSLLTAYLILAWTEPSAAPPASNISICPSCDSSFINTIGDDSMTGNLTIGSGGAGYVYLGNRGYYIGDDLGGTDIQTNAPNFYVYDGDWKRLLREGDTGIGDITAVNAGTGLTDGGISGDITLNVDLASIQSRVSGTCDAGSSIRVINQDGTVSCETDDTGSGGVQGGGILNYLSKFTDTGTIGNSQIFDDGTNVGIGIRTPLYGLDVSGSTRLTGNVGIDRVPRTDSYKLSMGGHIHMNNNNINYINQLHFNDNVRLYDAGNDNYLNFKYGDTGAGGIRIYDGDSQLQGSLYANGSQQFGLLDGDGNWSYHLVKDDYTRFLINNSEKMRITSAGNVGIGTTGPTQRLQVNGDIRMYNTSGATTRLYFEGNAGGTNYIQGNGSDNSIAIMPLGNVGIGTTNPSQKLDVSGNVRATWHYSQGNAGWYNETYGVGINAVDSTWVRIYPSGKYFRAQYIYQDGPAGYVASINGTLSSGYVPRADGSYRITNGTIYDNGNVGIGTTSPGAKLHVNGGIKMAAQTRYYSITPTDFTITKPSTDWHTISYAYARADMVGITFVAPVHLPHGAVVTAVKIYGNSAAAAEWMYMGRINRSGSRSYMAAANIGSLDTSISYSTIDNSNYSYTIYTSSLDTNDKIYGGYIKYTITSPYP